MRPYDCSGWTDPVVHMLTREELLRIAFDRLRAALQKPHRMIPRDDGGYLIVPTPAPPPA